MTSIAIRERVLKDGKLRLVLDYYLLGGKRKTEKLDLTVVALNSAFDDKIIQDKIGQLVKSIREQDTYWEYLTVDELKSLLKSNVKATY